MCIKYDAEKHVNKFNMFIKKYFAEKHVHKAVWCWNKNQNDSFFNIHFGTFWQLGFVWSEIVHAWGLSGNLIWDIGALWRFWIAKIVPFQF